MFLNCFETVRTPFTCAGLLFFCLHASPALAAGGGGGSDLVPRLETPAEPQAAGGQDAGTQANQQEKPAAADSEPSTSHKDDDDGGLYFSLGAGPIFGLESSHGWNEDCPSVSELNWTPTCSTKPPIGLVGEARLGYRFGPLGLEAFALGSGDWTNAKLGGQAPPLPIPSAISEMQIGRVGGGFGGGLRLVTSPNVVRIGAGAGGGMMLRHVYSNVSSLGGNSTSYAAPMVRGDVSVTLIDTLTLGVIGWVEFSEKVTVTPDLSSIADLAGVPVPPATLGSLEDALGDITVFDGTQFFIGPYIALHFGS